MYVGLNTGWTMDPSGNTNFPGSVSSTIAQMKQAGASWVRMSIGGGWSAYHDWTTADASGLSRLQKIDAVVAAVKAGGLKILGLIDGGTVTGYGQAQWAANSAEMAGGMGDNPFIDQMGSTFAMLSAHYAGQIDAWEVWNEPNAWTQSYGVGGSFIYPSNFAWLLRRIKENQKDSAPIVSGGIFAFADGSGLHTGIDYLNAAVSQAAQQGFTVEYDYVGLHLYMSIEQYPQTLAAYAGGAPLFVTEWGWATPPSTEQQQAQYLASATQTFRSSPVAGAFWFKLQDDSALKYGLLRSDGSAKPALATFQSGGFMDTQIQLHWNSYFSQMQAIFPHAGIVLPRVGTGIYQLWYSLYLNGKQLGPATSQEYPITDWSGNPGVAQDFGSCRIEWFNSVGHAYGPYGEIA